MASALIDASALVAVFGKNQPHAEHYRELLTLASLERWALSTTWPCVIEAAYLVKAPQRFALCAAYRLPLLHEAVPDAGPYRDYALFAPYERLAATARGYLSGKYDVPTETYPGDRLYNWLCVEHTFRQSVMEALKP